MKINIGEEERENYKPKVLLETWLRIKKIGIGGQC